MYDVPRPNKERTKHETLKTIPRPLSALYRKANAGSGNLLEVV